VSRVRDALRGPDWGVRSLDGQSASDSVENREAIFRLALPLLAGLTVFGVASWAAIPLQHQHPRHAHLLAMSAILITPAILGAPAYFMFRRRLPVLLVHPAAIGIITVLAILAFLAGPDLSPLIAMGFIPASTIAFIGLRRRFAFAYVTYGAALYAAVVYHQRHNTIGLTRWIDVVGSLFLVGLAVVAQVDRANLLARHEREAREEATYAKLAAEHDRAATEAAREELAQLNRTLESRVEEQVGELEQMSKLRRFLSPQVADRVLAADSESMLEPHRCQIAVFYCDLRGFTRFSAGAEPEDIVEILDAYYHVVGNLIQKFEATVGGFAGDGIMAFFNDPVPCDDPAYLAVQMALALAEPMSDLLDRWTESGYDLGYGIGITYGYATLGSVASRLCGEARTGEILVDTRTQRALRDRIPTAPRNLVLKGIPEPVTAYLVAGVPLAHE